ncbi:DivIVA domain-containing protein [Micromonospora sp. CPCC 205371]|nr:DivIVA domain-containing protein [Micromonospora sp. CPCC 205371]
MPLTPADVHNVAFKKRSIGKRGYDEGDVDAFLDEVEQELIRLVEANEALRARVERAGSADSRLAEVRAQLERAERDKAAAVAATRAAEAELEQVTGPGGAAVDAGRDRTLRVLEMARRTAEDHIADAQHQADRLVADARVKADKLLHDAHAAAEALAREARHRHQQAIADADANRTAALREIEDMLGFQREYRSRLEAHLRGQLRDLEGPEQESRSA